MIAHSLEAVGSPREAIAQAVGRFAPLPRAERQARASLWTMYYLAALIIPAVTTAVRSGRVPATDIDTLLCTADSDGHVVTFRPACATCPSRDPTDGFDCLVRDHLAVLVECCTCVLPAGVAWSNAAVMIDHALSEARLAGPRDAAALRAAEALLAGERHPPLGRPFRAGKRRVCCLRDRLPESGACPGICPRAR